MAYNNLPAEIDTTTDLWPFYFQVSALNMLCEQFKGEETEVASGSAGDPVTITIPAPGAGKQIVVTGYSVTYSAPVNLPLTLTLNGGGTEKEVRPMVGQYRDEVGRRLLSAENTSVTLELPALLLNTINASLHYYIRTVLA